MRADPLRHPLIFYYGHTAVFYINKLILSGVLKERLNRKLESIFAVGVDEMSWDDLNMSNYNWPSFDEAKAYRNLVRETVCELIQNLPLEMPLSWESEMWIILMGIEHQRIHIETSSVLIRQLPLEHLTPIEGWQICNQSGASPTNALINIKGGSIQLGKPYDAPLYDGITNMEQKQLLLMISRQLSFWFQMVNLNSLSMLAAIEITTTGRKRAGTGATTRMPFILVFGSRLATNGNFD